MQAGRKRWDPKPYFWCNRKHSLRSGYQTSPRGLQCASGDPLKLGSVEKRQQRQ